MTQQEQEDLLAVCLFDNWQDKGHYIENDRYAVKKDFIGRTDFIKYRESWDWQIPVWAKLCKDPFSFSHHNFYYRCIDNDKPAEGFAIIVSIIKRIK